jgi:hypothetical protein
MAFQLEAVDLALVVPSVVARASPTRHFVRIMDQRLVSMISAFTQCYETELITEGAPKVTLVSETALAFMMYDELIVPEEVLPSKPLIGFPRVRVKLSALTRVLTLAVDTHGMHDGPRATMHAFVHDLREALRRVPEEHKPRVLQGELVVSPTIDFGLPRYSSYAYARWFENFSLQALRGSGDTLSGWGMLVYSTDELWEAEVRYSEHSSFLSISSQWWARIVNDHYGGTPPTHRPEIFCARATEALNQALRWIDTYEFGEDTILREMQFMQLLELSSPQAKVVEDALRVCMYSVLHGIDGFESLRKLMGRTTDSSEILTHLKALRREFTPALDTWDMSAFMQIERQVSERVRFCDLSENKDMTDRSRVDYLLALRTAASHSVKKQEMYNGKVDAESEEVKRSMTADDLYDYHTSEIFEMAKRVLTGVLNDPEVTRLKVVRAVLKIGHWQLSQFIVGKLVLTGHEMYTRLSAYRLDWGWGLTANVDYELGALLGQELMRGDKSKGIIHPDHMGVTLAGSGVVKALLGGQLSALNFEEAFLQPYYKARSGISIPVTTEDQRFTDYQNIDMLIAKVGPVFELFGCGPDVQESSFASLMEAAKAMARDIAGLPSSKQKALIFGDFGLRSIMFEALNNAGARLRRLFYNKDKLVTIPSVFITGSAADHAFLHRLRIQQDATAEERRRSMIFDSDSGGTTEGELRAVLERVQAEARAGKGQLLHACCAQLQQLKSC